MKRIIAATAMMLAIAGAAIAQSAPTTPIEFTIKVSPDDLNLIGKAIEELPAKIANPLTQRLSVQIGEQVKAYNEASKKAQEPKPDQPTEPVPLPKAKP